MLLANQGLNPDQPNFARALGLLDSSGSLLVLLGLVLLLVLVLVTLLRFALASRAIFTGRSGDREYCESRIFGFEPRAIA